MNEGYVRKQISGDLDGIFEKWLRPDHIRLHAGEMTAQEMRSVKAVLAGVRAEIGRKVLGDPARPSWERFVPSERLREIFRRKSLAAAVIEGGTSGVGDPIWAHVYAAMARHAQALRTMDDRTVEIGDGNTICDPGLVAAILEWINMADGEEFLSVLHDEIVSYLDAGGVLEGEWGNLAFYDEILEFELVSLRL